MISRQLRRIRTLTIVALAAISSCTPLKTTSSAPTTFLKSMEPGWASFEVREGISPDRAWTTVFQLLARSFDVEVAQKEDGYIRTAWSYTWTGTYMRFYRVRITAMFAEGGKRLDVRTEAQFSQSSEEWVVGTDTSLLTTMKTDLMGTIGRTTR
jgi:hypothetical protein